MTTMTAEVPVQEWTSDTIYAENFLDHYSRRDHTPVPPCLRQINAAPQYFSSAFVTAVHAEKEWIADPLPRFHPDLQEAVGMKRVECPYCEWGYVEVIHRGQTTGVVVTFMKKCPCAVYRHFWRVWGDSDRVPKRFRLAGAKGPVTPSSHVQLSIARQEQILKTVYADTSRSYFLSGAPETGKTYILTAIYRKALERATARMFELDNPQPSVWRINASVLLDQHVAWETRHSKPEGSVPCPYLLTSMIHSAVRYGFRPCLFLDEIDKIVKSEFKLKRLIQLVDAVYEAEGQIVATSNKSVSQLMAEWGGDEAGTMLRRIGKGTGAKTIYFKESQA